MSSPIHRTRDAVKAQTGSKHIGGFRWLHWTVAGLGVCLIVAVLLTSWLRRTVSSVETGSTGLLNRSGERVPTEPLKPTLSATSSVEEITGELRRITDQLANSFPNDVSALDVVAQVEFGLGR